MVNAAKKSRPRLSFRKKLLFSGATTLFFFLLLEGLLTLVGFEPVTSTEDPFVGFSSRLPLMQLTVDPSGNEIYKTAKNKLVWFNDQSFPKKKGPKTKRIFCMGGSTTYGHPYWDSTSFSRWLRDCLPIIDDSSEWEVINAGGISYASYRVASLMEELAQYEPDIFVIYSVHNEFLERRTYQGMFERSSLSLQLQSTLARTRIWTLTDRVIKQTNRFGKTSSMEAKDSKRDLLPAEVDEILNHTVGPIDYHRDEEWRRKVLQHYESNLKRMIAIAEKAGAKILFVTPTSNEMDCSPFKSEFAPKLSEIERSKLLGLGEDASNDFRKGSFEDSIQKFQEALKIDPHFAETHYRLGQSYLKLSRIKEAQQSFSQAIQEDVCPLRAVREIRASIERVTQEAGVPMVDFEKELRTLCEQEQGHPIFGEGHFLDHVHPTVEVHRELALWIIQAMQNGRLVAGKSIHDSKILPDLEKVRSKVLKEIDKNAQGISMRNLAKVFHWAGKFEEAIRSAQSALELIPDDPESRFVLARCLQNIRKNEESLAEYEKLFDKGKEYPRALQPFGELLLTMGHWNAAKAYLLLAIVREPKNASGHFSLGLVHLRLEEFKFAADSFAEADRLFPNDPYTLYYLAKSKSGEAKFLESVAIFEKLLSSGSPRGYEAEVHYSYGLALLKVERQAKAFDEFEATLKIDPSHAGALEQLARSPP